MEQIKDERDKALRTAEDRDKELDRIMRQVGVVEYKAHDHSFRYNI